MESVFLQVVNMSYVGSIVIVFIIMARRLLKKVPKKYMYILWVVPLIRLIIPFSIESMISLVPVNPSPITQDILYSPTPQINTGISSVDSILSSYLPKAMGVTSVNPMQIWIFIGSCIWLLGIIMLLSFGMTSFLKLKRKLEYSSYQKESIYYAASVKTPFVLGLIRPRIYLPVSLSEDEIDYIILHERTHIRRLDHVIRFISYLALCIHWFNPFVWIAFWLSGKDMEMSCDEAVIKQLGPDVKKNYAKSLLNLTTGKQQFRITPLAFGEGDTKMRIKNILNFKRSKFYMILGITILLVAVIGFLSNPKSKESNTNNFNLNDESITPPKVDERASVAKKFLNTYYNVTTEEVSKQAEFLSSMSKENLSAEDAQSIMTDYSSSLTSDYTEFLTQKEIDRLLANREFDKLRQLAFEQECTYEVSGIALIPNIEKENYIIFDYTVSLPIRKNNNVIVNIVDITGKIRVDLENQKYLVSYIETGSLDALKAIN